MPENWNYQQLNIWVRQGRQFKVPIVYESAKEAADWCERNEIRHEFCHRNDWSDPAFYFRTSEDAFMFALRWKDT
jgi:hypothetical protein